MQVLPENLAAAAAADPAGGGDLTLARSAAYLVLVLSQMVHIFECRGRGFSVAGNPYLLFSALASAAITLLTVYLPVLQEGVFPTYQAVQAGDLEEEKRVFYVSLTRAKKQLFLSWAHQQPNRYPAQPSRFLSLLWP